MSSEPDISGSRTSVTPRKSFAVLSGDTPIFTRMGVLAISAALIFGAGGWATTMSSAIAQLTNNAAKTDAKLEKLEGLMLEVLRAQPVKGSQ